MARISIEDSDDEFSGINDLVASRTPAPRSLRETSREVKAFTAERNGKKRVLLGKMADNPLLRPLGRVEEKSERRSAEGMVSRLKGKSERSERRQAMIELDEREDCFGNDVERSTVKGVRIPKMKMKREDLGAAVELGGSGNGGLLAGEASGTAKKPRNPRSVELKVDEDDVFGEPAVPKIKPKTTRSKKIKEFVEPVKEEEDEYLATKPPRTAFKVSRIKVASPCGSVELGEADEDVFGEATIPKPKPKSGRRMRIKEPASSEEDDIHTSRKPSRTASKAATIKEASPCGSVELGADDDVFGQNWEESDDMSDFVVNDSDVEESIIEDPAPKSIRRLVKGRRPAKEAEAKEAEEAKEDLEQMLEKLNMEDDFSDPFSEPPQRSLKQKESSTKSDTRDSRKSSEDKALPQKKQPKSKHSFQTSVDLDDPFTLRFSPSERTVFKGLRFVTPPGSPVLKPKGLASPKKAQRIPSTPHAPHTDDFWSQDVVNDWNDEYSPRKTPKPPAKSLFSKNISLPDDVRLSPKKSSPVKRDRIKKDTKKAFSEAKHTLAESFLIELDNAITNGEVAKLAMSTGGVKIIWSKKLNTTAGRANWKRETVRSSTLVGPDGKPVSTFRHHAAIELAEKVIDDEDRLLNVIAHEFCHLANFMISNIKTNPHGKEFKAWASKVSRQFGDRGIEVTTKHSYEIDYKYIWECENCGLEFKRHSKSIDPARHRCGSCKAKLVQTRPVPRNGGTVSEYQMFLKENMKIVKKENPKSPQKDILGLVGKKYQEFKANKAAGKSEESVEITEVDVVSKESTPEEDSINFVSRKLDFLDLTSP